tara:strand:- start:742 stop:975 length:234 start_codon:yes stop_codon:yes gene_type:complete
MTKFNFDKIRNPETNRWVSIHGKAGKKVLHNYMILFGAGTNNNTSPNILLTYTSTSLLKRPNTTKKRKSLRKSKQNK